MNQREALGQKRGFQETGEGAHHIEPDRHLLSEPAKLRDKAVDRLRVVLDRAVENDPALAIHRHRPMRDLRRVYANANLHRPASFPTGASVPRPACIALQSHRGIA
ncbi:MAG: hypothetical protein JKP98_26670 [Rhodobacteraceae bacterium]|nr:hypothetical protein [Paracoccaceae bacterium]